MAAGPISKLPKNERQALLDDLNYLNTAEIIDLRNAGVSNKVIDFMINTPTMYPPPPPPRMYRPPPPGYYYY